MLILEEFLSSIEPIVDINLKLEKMDHNIGIDIVIQRLKEFQYESKGVKYQIKQKIKITNSRINLRSLYKSVLYCDIIKDLSVIYKNNILNYEILHLDRDNNIINRAKNIKNIPLCYFKNSEEPKIYIEIIDNKKIDEIKISFFGFLLRDDIKICISEEINLLNKDGYKFKN
jgi:hypothetical protein